MITLFLLAALAPAMAQDTGAPDDRPVEIPVDAVEVPLALESPPASDTPEPNYIEVVVIGEHVISDARDKLVREMEKLGWRSKRKRNGEIVFSGPKAWMGKAIFDPMGDLSFTRPVLAITGPRESGGAYDPSRQLDNDQQAGTVGLSAAVLPTKRRLEAIQRAVLDEVNDDVGQYRRLLQQRWFSRYVQDLPDRMDALWVNGEALDGSDRPVTEPAAKRAKVLDFWATRTDTPEGRTVSRTVEIWLRETVMSSDTPVTREEAAEAESRRADGRRLEVF